MLKKLGIYVCPEDGCPALGKRPGQQCPKHNVELVRRVYALQSQDRTRADSTVPSGFGDILGNIFGDSRPGAGR